MFIKVFGALSAYRELFIINGFEMGKERNVNKLKFFKHKQTFNHSHNFCSLD